MSEKGEIYTASKNFTLPLAVTAWKNLFSEIVLLCLLDFNFLLVQIH